MMKPLLAVLLLSVAAPLAAQSSDLPGRVGKLEKEMRAVQRKVFPTGTPLEPEITPAPAPVAPAGNPASNPVADLTARVDALEAQVRSITGQAEQASFRLNQLEEQVKRLQAETDARAAAAAAPPAPTGGPAEGSAEPAQASTGVERPSTGDPAEDGYLYGFRLWQAKQYDAAAAELKAVADKFPKHRRASFAQNLLGRAYLDQGKPALASVAFYDNYQKWPKGERAPESLYWLGMSLTQLKKPAEACKVFAEFRDVYGGSAAAGLKAQVEDARKKAKCA
jgi:TolA-binding protein